MSCDMPDTLGDHLTVSADEEAYLRAAFRRFALPYMLGALAVFAIVGLWLIGRAAEPRVDVKPVVAQAVLDEIRAESLALRAQLGKVLERVNAVGHELGAAASRVDELERRVERVTGRGGVGRSELAALTKRLDDADQRIAQLEARRTKLEARAPSPAPAQAPPGNPTRAPAGGSPGAAAMPPPGAPTP
jgi:tetrahydromethanopterin S-methyltransferase subunit G